MERFRVNRRSAVKDSRVAPPGIDASVATAARMYDFWLGGHDNFAADRIAALKVTNGAPEVPLLARENRKFLGRAVRLLAGQAGIRQFLDLGTGLPTKGNVHQVAQAAAGKRPGPSPAASNGRPEPPSDSIRTTRHPSPGQVTCQSPTFMCHTPCRLGRGESVGACR